MHKHVFIVKCIAHFTRKTLLKNEESMQKKLALRNETVLFKLRSFGGGEREKERQREKERERVMDC